MAQDIIVPILVCLCIFQNPNSTALSLGEAAKKQDNTLSSECQSCGKVEKKIRREVPGISSRDAKHPSENLREYLHPRKSNSIDYLLLKGWGARGMPFNVLYTPNIQQQKMMKYMPLIYNLVPEGDKSSRTSRKKHTAARKYYSLIPQLFVSYGW